MKDWGQQGLAGHRAGTESDEERKTSRSLCAEERHGLTYTLTGSLAVAALHTVHGESRVGAGKPASQQRQSSKGAVLAARRVVRVELVGGEGEGLGLGDAGEVKQGGSADRLGVEQEREMLGCLQGLGLQMEG